MKARCPIIAAVLLTVAACIPACSCKSERTGKSQPRQQEAKPKVASKKPIEIDPAAQERAIAAIEKVGGKVQRDETLPNKPVGIVTLSKPNITDAQMAHLKGMTELKKLYLGGSKITDAGLENLKGLTKLEILGIGNTKVTDAGLVHLRGLYNLKLLSLSRTKVTDEGVKELQKALPNCIIGH